VQISHMFWLLSYPVVYLTLNFAESFMII